MNWASAKLRKPVSVSERATLWSMAMVSSPARKRTNCTISPIASLGWWPARIRSATAMAPALMKGLRGLPFSNSSWTIELNAGAGRLAPDRGP